MKITCIKGLIVCLFSAILLVLLSCAPAPDPDTYIESSLQAAQEEYSKGEFETALKYYEEAEQLTSESTPLVRAGIQKSLGDTHKRLGHYDKALLAYSQAIELFPPDLEASESAPVFQARGIVYRRLGRHAESEENFKVAVELLGDTPSVALFMAFGNLGAARIQQSKYAQALAAYQNAIRVSDNYAAINASLRARILTDLGMTRIELGDYEGAFADLQTALSYIEGEALPRVRGRIHHHLGYAYFKRGELEEIEIDVKRSIEEYQKALTYRERAKDQEGQGKTLNNLGYAQAYMGKYGKAKESLMKALEIARSERNRNSEARTLDSIAKVHMYLSDYPVAENYLIESLTIAMDIGDRGLEHVTLANLGRIYLALGDPNLAIVFLKKSVDIIEKIRREHNKLPASTKKLYADSVADTYRLLADVLLSQNRPLEAENVIDLLRIEEAVGYIDETRSDDSELNILPGEQEVLNDYSELLAEAIRQAREYAQLSKVPRQARTDGQKVRLDEIGSEQEKLYRIFLKFKDSQEVQHALQTKNLEEQLADVQLDNLLSLAERLRPNEVLFYPFILPDRLELIYATSKSVPTNISVSVTEERLRKATFDFRQALIGRSRNVIEPSRQLYRWMLKPLDEAIDQLNLDDDSKIDTIVYVPDGILRYIPLAALHDGKNWVAKKYRINLITARSISAFDEPNSEITEVLAGAFTSDRSFTELDGKVSNFKGLAHAQTEVQEIKELFPNADIHLDTDFSYPLFSRSFRDFQIVHLATHGVFVPGQSSESSYIVFGDGVRATLSDVKTWLMQNVDLVVLSACETGVGGKLGNGEELHGFGYLMQKAGADAAIATLWKVSDGGTQAFMGAFYRNLKMPGTNKAEALQKAQLALLEGQLDSDVESSNRGPRPVNNSYDPSGFEHPYYWAPFVLIGNGH